MAGQSSARAPLPAEEKLAATAQQGWGQGLSLHAWLVGSNRTKLRPQLILLLSKRTGEVWGGSWQPWGTPTDPSSTAAERAASQISPSVLRAESLREKLSLLREDGAETLLPPCQKTKGLFFSQAFLQGLGPPQLHRLPHPGTRAAAGFAGHNPPSRSLEKNQLDQHSQINKL